MIASDYPFLDVFWTMFIFFIWILWFMLLFNVWGDLFRRDDLSGLGKTGWFIFTIVLPFLGVFIYLLTQNDGMSQRAIARARGQQAELTTTSVRWRGAAVRQPRSSGPSSCSTAAPSHRRNTTPSSRRHWRNARLIRGPGQAAPFACPSFPSGLGQGRLTRP